MQIILSEEEYNALLTRAGQVEAQVEIRLEEEKKRLWAHIVDQCRANKFRDPREIIEMIKKVVS